METLKKKWDNLPIRKFFIGTVAFIFSIVVLLSALIIWGSISFQNYLLPDSNFVYLTIEETLADGSVVSGQYRMELDSENQAVPQLIAEYDDVPVKNDVQASRYSIQKIENTYDRLTPKRKLAYQICGISMIGLPALLSLSGILLCSFYFYRKKIALPLQLLTDATKQIAAQNLDFTMEYDCGDEMGLLCQSFEKMKNTLYENNKAMWNLLEEKKLMQASIAHDLRNPIAIIEGYAEYLQINLSGGHLSTERIGQITKNLTLAAKRLESYTESLRTLNYIEATAVEKKECSAWEMAEDIFDDLQIMAYDKNICLSLKNSLPDVLIQADRPVISRILENVFRNALRFAKKSISIDIRMENALPLASGLSPDANTHSNTFLIITVSDDGCGFSKDILNSQEKQMLPKPQEDGHMGMGLKISRLLCEKHGGELNVRNSQLSGAVAEIRLLVS